jgi:hypothetical protein
VSDIDIDIDTVSDSLVKAAKGSVGDFRGGGPLSLGPFGAPWER